MVPMIVVSTRQQIDLDFAFVNQAAIAIDTAMLYGREQDTINKLQDLDQKTGHFCATIVKPPICC